MAREAETDAKNTEEMMQNEASNATAMEKTEEDTIQDAEMSMQDEQVRSLQGEVESLKFQLLEATTRAQLSNNESNSIDLMDFDDAQDPTEEPIMSTPSTPIYYRQPTWLNAEYGLPGAYPDSDDGRNYDLPLPTPPYGRFPHTATENVASAGNQPTAPTTATTDLDVNTLQNVDNAVEAMAHIQRNALRNGKAVAVQMKTPEEMAAWVENRGANLLDNNTDAERTLVTMWL